MAATPKLHPRSCRYFTSIRPVSALQYLRRSSREAASPSHSCKAAQSYHWKHLTVQALQTDQGAASGSRGQTCSRPSASNVRSALSTAAAHENDSAQDAGLLPELGRRVLSTLTAAALALAILFSSTPTAYAAGFPFAPRVSSTPATLEMKVSQRSSPLRALAVPEQVNWLQQERMPLSPVDVGHDNLHS